jgi:REP element-mobilizing transposase RayT
MSRGNGGETICRTDEHRRRCLRLLAGLPGRFGAEIGAFVLMANHYQLLVRCRRTDPSETLRWLKTAYGVRCNWAHRGRGHVFQGRFKSVLIHDEGALDRVASYLHLNPVRIGGLGLGKDAQRRARILGGDDPGAELVGRRLRVLGSFRGLPGGFTRD